MNRILTAGITGSAMILIILILRAILKNRLPKRTFVILWLIAALRMIIPIQPIGVIQVPGAERTVQEAKVQNQGSYSAESAWVTNPTENITESVPMSPRRQTGANNTVAEQTEAAKAADNAPVSESETMKSPAKASETYTQKPEQFRQEEAPVLTVQPEKEKSVRLKISLKTRLSQWIEMIRAFRLPDQAVRIIRIVYICGVTGTLLVFFALYIIGFRRFGKTKNFLNSELLTWLSSHKLRRKLTIKVASGIRSPLTYGILNPVILIPEDFIKASDESWKYALEHEFRHIRNFDFTIKMICALASAVHFYNPLVWLMFAFVNQDIEYACDEQVLRILGADSKKAYAGTLLQMSLREKQTHAVFLRAGFGKNPVTKRIRRISLYKRTGALAAAFSVLLAAILISCSTVGVSQKETESTADDKQAEATLDEARKAVEAAESALNQADEETETFITELLKKEQKLNELGTRFSLPGCYRKTAMTGDGRSVIDSDVYFYISPNSSAMENEPLSARTEEDLYRLRINDMEGQNTVWDVSDGLVAEGEGDPLFELRVTSQHDGQAEQFLLIRTSGSGEKYQLYSRDHLQDFEVSGNYLLETDSDSEGRVRSFLNIDSPGLTSFGEMRFFRDGSYDGSYKTTVLYDDEGSQFVVLAYSGGELKYYGSIPVPLEHGSKEPQPLNEITLFGYEGEHKSGREIGVFRKAGKEDPEAKLDFLNYLSELSQPGQSVYLANMPCQDIGRVASELPQLLFSSEKGDLPLYNATDTLNDAQMRFTLCSCGYSEVSRTVLDGLSDEMIVLHMGTGRERLMAVLDGTGIVLFLNRGEIHCYMPDTTGVLFGQLSLRGWYDEALLYAMGDVTMKGEIPVIPDHGQTLIEAVQEYCDLADGMRMKLPHGNRYACRDTKSTVIEAKPEWLAPAEIQEEYANTSHEDYGAFLRKMVWIPESEDAYAWQATNAWLCYTGEIPEVSEGGCWTEVIGWARRESDGWHIFVDGPAADSASTPDDTDKGSYETRTSSFIGTYVRIAEGKPGYDFSDTMTVSESSVTTHRKSEFNVIHREENGDLLCVYELEGVVYQKMRLHSEVFSDGKAQTIEVTEYRNDTPQETLRYMKTDYYEADYTGVYADPDDPQNNYLMLDDFGRLYRNGKVMYVMATDTADGQISLDAYDETGRVPYQSVILDPGNDSVSTLRITEADGRLFEYQLLRDFEDTSLSNAFTELQEEENLYITRSEGSLAGQILDGRNALNWESMLFGASNSKYMEVAVPEISGPVITVYGSDSGKRISLLEDYDVILYENHGERHAYVRTASESEYSALYSGWRAFRSWYDEVEYYTLFGAGPGEDVVIPYHGQDALEAANEYCELYEKTVASVSPGSKFALSFCDVMAQAWDRETMQATASDPDLESCDLLIEYLWATDSEQSWRWHIAGGPYAYLGDRTDVPGNTWRDSLFAIIRLKENGWNLEIRGATL